MSTNPPSFPPPPGPPPGFPPQGPPPGFPPQGPPPGRPPGKGPGNGLWIALGVVGVVALVGVVVGLVLVLAGDGDDDERGRDDSPTTASGAAPDEVVEDLIDAAEEGDCDQAKTYLAGDATASDPCATPEFRLLSNEDVDAEVGRPQTDDDAAVVPVTFTSNAGSTDYEFVLERIDGAWLVTSYDVAHGADDPTDEPTDPSTSATDRPTSAAPSPSGSSSAGSVANEPTAVVEAFLDAAFAGDCATAEDLVTPAYLKEEGRCDASEIPSDFGTKATYTVGRATVRGTTATVPMKLRYAGSDESSTVRLTQVGGRWLISDID